MKLYEWHECMLSRMELKMNSIQIHWKSDCTLKLNVSLIELREYRAVIINTQYTQYLDVLVLSRVSLPLLYS